jgi:hypothetical protein
MYFSKSWFSFKIQLKCVFQTNRFAWRDKSPSKPLVNKLSVPQHRSRQQQGVDAIQNPAMAGQQRAGILDAG